MKMNKCMAAVLIASSLCLPCLSGCTEAERVKHNVKQEADNFNVTRRLTVINSRSDKVMLELIGNLSIDVDSADRQLEVTIEVEEGVYKIDYINLNEWTTYIVEDISGANVSQYHYEINYLPETMQVYEITNNN